MRRLLTLNMALVAALGLASCQSGNSLTPKSAVATGPATAAPVSPLAVINGKWVPTDANAAKVYYNEFRNGKFVSRSPDGKQTIAAGKYTVADTGDINMNWYSEARKANASATCKQLSQSELQCTANGSVFNLRRA